MNAERCRAHDRGGITPFVMLACLALVALLGLVVEGGRALGARDTALGEAEQAARAGATQLSPASLHAGRTGLQVQKAISAAERYMAVAGRPGTAEVIGTSVVATVRTFQLPTPLLALIGVNHLAVAASASATAAAG